MVPTLEATFEKNVLVPRFFRTFSENRYSEQVGGRGGYCDVHLLARELAKKTHPARSKTVRHLRDNWLAYISPQLRTQLKANGEDVKVVQESLRHANSRITLDTYTQAVTLAKRQTQTNVVSMILPRPIQTAEAGGGK